MKKKKLISCIRNQFIAMLRKKSFWIAFDTILLYTFAVYIMNIMNCIGHDVSSIFDSSYYFLGSYYNDYLELFSLAFPILVVLPFSFTYFEDAESHNLQFIQSRVGKSNYVIASAIVCFWGSFIVIFIPFLLNIILNYITFPQNDVTVFGVKESYAYWLHLYGEEGIPRFAFLDLFIYNQNLYNLLVALLLSGFAGLLGVFAYTMSFYIKKYKLLLFLPVYLLFLVTNNLYLIGFRFFLIDYLVTVPYHDIRNILFPGIIITLLSIILISLNRRSKWEDWR